MTIAGLMVGTRKFGVSTTVQPISGIRVGVELTLGFIILLQVGETSTDRVQLALSLFRVLARAEELWLGQVALGEFLAQV